MHLVIISGAARPRSKSNTAKVIAAFQKGFEENGNTTEVWYLSDRRQWESAAKAFRQNERILIAFPLYVENIPGILLEFLSGLTPKRHQAGVSDSGRLPGGKSEPLLRNVPGNPACSARL